MALPTHITLANTSLSAQTMLTSMDANAAADLAYFTSKDLLVGQKLVTIGDSITFQDTWQATLAAALGLSYSSTETTNGTGGHKAMGVGSTTISPLNDLPPGAGQSIYLRCDDVDFYSPDIIILTGGENDSTTSNVGTIYDTTYTGGELPTGDPGLPTFCGAWKGCLKKLRDQNPNALIFTQTNMFAAWDMSQATFDRIYNRHVACTAMAAMFGATHLNNLYAGIAPTPHPTAGEGVIWGKWLARQINGFV